MEIESKILITKEQYDELRQNAVDSIIMAPECTRKDVYRSLYATEAERKANNEPMIRIRTENDAKHFLTIKRKSIQDGTEVNEEYETLIADIKPIEVLCPHVWYEKTKVAIGYSLKFINFDVHVEFVQVSVQNKDPIYAVEIEVTDDKVSVEMAKSAIKLAFTYLGFADPESKYEVRSWRQLLDIC